MKKTLINNIENALEEIRPFLNNDGIAIHNIFRSTTLKKIYFAGKFFSLLYFFLYRDLEYNFSDNYFDLRPNQQKVIRIKRDKFHSWFTFR